MRADLFYWDYLTQPKLLSNGMFSGAGPECFYPSGTDTSAMAMAAQTMDGTSNEIDYRDIFGTIRAGKGDWDGSIFIF